MAQLKLGKQYKSGTDSSVGVTAHEPNGDFWTYRINAANTIDNSMALPDPSVFYPFAQPDTLKNPVITITPVDNIGVKKFIGWGAGAHYHPSDSEYSYLALPIHKKLNEKEPPNVSITNSASTVKFNIEQNNSVKYETVRLVVQQGNIREEKVLYFDKTGTIQYEMVTAFTSLVTASVRAHADEINTVSELVEEELNLSGVLESSLTITQNSAARFNHNPDVIKFTDDRGMSIENIALKREVDGQYSSEGAVIKTIPIPDRSTYGDDYTISVVEV